MMKTRRQLDAENKALRARLGAAAGETRKLLHERLRRTQEENAAKTAEIEKLAAKLESLEAQLLALQAVAP